MFQGDSRSRTIHLCLDNSKFKLRKQIKNQLIIIKTNQLYLTVNHEIQINQSNYKTTKHISCKHKHMKMQLEIAYLLSIEGNRMQKSSSLSSPSAKSLACQTHDFSFPACS